MYFTCNVNQNLLVFFSVWEINRYFYIFACFMYNCVNFFDSQKKIMIWILTSKHLSWTNCLFFNVASQFVFMQTCVSKFLTKNFIKVFKKLHLRKSMSSFKFLIKTNDSIIFDKFECAIFVVYEFVINCYINFAEIFFE